MSLIAQMPPHVFAIAEAAYYNMNAYKDNQAVIISGESGAGKTEAAKRIMQYIANVSSRFGKYLQIQFNAQGEPVGADITNYLLEKSRVVGQVTNERNFHIFYQFTKGASSSYRENFGIQKPETYLYTSKSKCLNVDGIDDLADFKETLNAMKIIRLSQAEQDEIFSAVDRQHSICRGQRWLCSSFRPVSRGFLGLLTRGYSSSSRPSYHHSNSDSTKW